MFPDKPGGIALYAHEGWRSRFSLFGPIAAFGYWDRLVGRALVRRQHRRRADRGGVVPQVRGRYRRRVLSTSGSRTSGSRRCIKRSTVILAVWSFNVLGVKPSLAVGYVTGALLMVPLFIFIVMPYITGDWSSSNLEYVHNVGDPSLGFSDLSIALMWLFIMCWSAYGVEDLRRASRPNTTTRSATRPRRSKSAAAFSLFGVHLPAPRPWEAWSVRRATTAASTWPTLKEIAGDVVRRRRGGLPDWRT